MVLAGLLCALICSLALNSIIRCFFMNRRRSLPAAGQQLPTAGIKKKALKTFPVVTFSSSDGRVTNSDTECVICLSEFAAGDRVKVLPKCNHGFHVKCIDKWLGSHSSCPTCRHCLVETCRKIAPPPPPPPQVMVAPAEAVVICMPPLEQEDLVRSYRGASS
ncbi:RING-H2 finger protein ATL78 [Linum perenne]